MIVDTSALLALFNDDELMHEDAVRILQSGTESRLVVPPYVIAELDHLLLKRYGVAVELAALRELAAGAFEHPAFLQHDLHEAIGVVERYRDQSIGVTDASIVVLAKRYDTRTIATLDRRHFEVLRPLQGGRFEIVP